MPQIGKVPRSDRASGSDQFFVLGAILDDVARLRHELGRIRANDPVVSAVYEVAAQQGWDELRTLQATVVALATEKRDAEAARVAAYNPPPIVIPKPGSADARILGCTCPTIDNGHGAGCGRVGGDGKPQYFITEGCPLHQHLIIGTVTVTPTTD